MGEGGGLTSFLHRHHWEQIKARAAELAQPDLTEAPVRGRGSAGSGLGCIAFLVALFFSGLLAGYVSLVTDWGDEAAGGAFLGTLLVVWILMMARPKMILVFLLGAGLLAWLMAASGGN